MWLTGGSTKRSNNTKFVFKRWYILEGSLCLEVLREDGIYIKHRLPLVWHLMGGLLELKYTPAFLSLGPAEEYWNLDMFHIMSNLCREFYALKSEIFEKLSAGMLFRFQWQIEKFWLELGFGPGFNSTSPLKMTCSSQIQKWNK